MSQTEIDQTAAVLFEAALRDLGLARVRLDQVVTTYHKTFPTEAMRPDMRQRLHDHLLVLVESGAVVFERKEEDGNFADDPDALPGAIKLIDRVIN